MIIGTAAGLILILAAGAIGGETATAIVAASGVLVFYIGYHVVFEVAGGGRTPGKRAAGLRVVMDSGGSIGLRASLIRNLTRLIEGLAFSYLPAMISVIATRNNQRIGDLFAGTLVVREPQKAPAAFAPPAPSIPLERFASWDVTAVGEVESTAVRSFLERRKDLDPGARAALAAQLAGHLRPLVAGVRPGLTDETFLEHLAAAKSRGMMQGQTEH
jgi:uncharacterized RDD family membrane protein YckC